MNQTLTHSIVLVNSRSLLILFICLGIAGAVVAFPLSYVSASNVMIGLCLFPFAIFIEGKKRVNWIYFIALAVFCELSFLYDIKIFYFFSLAFYFIFLLELFVGKVNTLILFLIVLMSPVFLQVSVIMGFPIRLWLSDLACTLLATVHLDVKAEGNMILYNGYTFTVDEACMGLNMLAISMLMGVFILVFQYKTTGRKLSLVHLIGFFLILFGLNILANLFRIIILVLFNIPPETITHEITGLLCLIIYTMVPLFFLGKMMIGKMGKPIPARSSPIEGPPVWRSVVLAAFSAVAIMSVGFSIDPVRTESEAQHAEVKMNGMHPEELSGGITKIFDGDLLIYVKPIPEFFTGEHTPLICWKGSGFVFKQVKKMNVGGHEIFSGILTKNGTELHTAWWYTNGEIETIDQLAWRTSMAKGEKRFCLVNVTTKDEQSLTENLQKIFSQELLVVR